MSNSKNQRNTYWRNPKNPSSGSTASKPISVFESASVESEVALGGAWLEHGWWWELEQLEQLGTTTATREIID